MLIFGAEKSALFNLKKWQTFFRNESMKKKLIWETNRKI